MKQGNIMSGKNSVDRTVDRMQQSFADAVAYKDKRREHSAYIYLNTKTKRDAFRKVTKELIVESVPTELFVVNGQVFKVEPIFDNDGNYVCEEIVLLGTLDGSKVVKTDNIRAAMGIT